jgi:hypothetical protein
LRLFPRCKVGSETIKKEAGSDLFAETVGTSAAVAASAGQGARSGMILPLRTLLASLRGFVLALWVMTRSAVQGSKAGAALVTGMLAVGGALVALTVLSEDPPALLVSVGAALLAAGLAVASLRAGAPKAMLLILLGLVIAVLPFLAAQVGGLVEDSKGQWWADALLWVKRHRQDLAPIFVVTGLVVGSMLLGIVRKRPRLPRGSRARG